MQNSASDNLLLLLWMRSDSERLLRDRTFELSRTNPHWERCAILHSTKFAQSEIEWSSSSILFQTSLVSTFPDYISFLAHLSYAMAGKCVHKGCGKTFSDPNEPCVYHPGPPVFHEGQKGKHRAVGDFPILVLFDLLSLWAGLLVGCDTVISQLLLPRRSC